MKILSLLLLLSLPLFAAANLQLGTSTLAADGKTITSVVTGCVVSLSPSIGITGLALYSNMQGQVETPVTVTAINCTLIITNGRPFAIEEVPVQAWINHASSNLTDTMGNTPVVTDSGAAVTVDITATEWLYGTQPTIANASRSEGSFVTTSASLKNALQFHSADGCLRFRASTSIISIYAFDFSNNWQLIADGVLNHDWGVQPGTATDSTLPPVTGLSGSHTYGICSIASQEQYPIIYMIRLTQGSLGARPASKKLITKFGASTANYSGPQNITDSRLGSLYQDGQSLSVADQYVGASGFTTCQLATILAASMTFSTADNWSVAIMDMSSTFNDVAASQSPATASACLATMLSALNSMSNPPTRILVEGMIGVGVTDYSAYDIANAAVCAPVANCRFTLTTSWINETIDPGSCTVVGDRQSDGIHIEGCLAGTGVGYAKIAAAEIPILTQMVFSTPTISGLVNISGNVGFQ